jgi:hypothetical protein
VTRRGQVCLTHRSSPAITMVIQVRAKSKAASVLPCNVSPEDSRLLPHTCTDQTKSSWALLATLSRRHLHQRCTLHIRGRSPAAVLRITPIRGYALPLPIYGHTRKKNCSFEFSLCVHFDRPSGIVQATTQLGANRTITAFKLL